MTKKLLIVESPAKAKTINKYLGNEFIVKSSYGHIRDLDKGNKGIDKENRFEPKYVVSPEKRRVVKELKDTVKTVSEVWLATDEDREGEAISWHLCKVLGLDEDTTKRIVFREITKSAIQKAIEEPRVVDKFLVNAQQARRILDRLVGFELSEILWRKVKGKLSAGRVQSVAVKLIVDREREINAHDARPFYKVVALFKVKNAQGKFVDLKAELKERYSTYEEAESFLNNHIGSNYTITDIIVKPSKRRPAPPFTTSTLQQDASRKLYFSVNRTMSTAQKLYE
ncbi:MAG: toprim domain-containing protein, partial [Bacteroidia bacterium]|nr:toprim domain-containing protein [Bacteroidia bacterium]